jgi:hypothetical protein
MRFSLDAELARPIIVEPGWQLGDGQERRLKLVNAPLIGQESTMRSYLKPELFPEGLAPFEVLEEMIQNADDNCVDADAFLLSPLLESEACFCANVKHLGARQRKAGLPGLHDLYIVLIDMLQSEKDDPGKITFDTRFFSHRFPQVDGEAESHARPLVGLRLFLGFRGLAFLDCYPLHEFLSC